MGEREPNLFDFATSELSQDAFICWLISWVNYPIEKELNKCAKSFVALLFNLNNPGKEITGDDVEMILGDIKKQYCKTDVYFKARINQKTESFIVEDKTDTTHHSDQLKRYLENISKETGLNEEIVLIYFKTGYLFGWDYDSIRHGYKILDYKTINSFLQKYSINNAIYNDYKKHIEELNDYYANHLSALYKPNGYNLFELDFVQYEFMKKLSENCPQHINKYYVDNGTNRGGTPWTSFDFIEFSDAINGEIDEQVYYRLDFRKNDVTQNWNYYLCLRHYAGVKGNSTGKEEKIKRLEVYKNIFSSIDKSSVKLKFSAVRNDWSGANQSEIAILFFDDKNNSPKNVLIELPAIHQKFVNEVKNIYDKS